MVNIIVPRKEAKEINGSPGWVLVFGRRKVGKSFLIRNFVETDVYMTIRANRSVRVEKGFVLSEIKDLDTLRDSVRGLLGEGKTVVIDEFQRAPMSVLEDIAAVHPSGKLILSGSSMRFSTEILGRSSPLLGLLKPIHIGMIDPNDMFEHMSPIVGAEKAVEYGPILMDPWTIPFFQKKDLLSSLIPMLPYVVNGLIGEIFREDQRSLTQTYASILSLLGCHITDIKKIAQTLYDRNLVGSPTSSSIIPYLKNLHTMGLVEEIKVYGKNRSIYQLTSFPMVLFFYLQDKYGIADRKFTIDEVEPAASVQLSFGIENYIADMMVDSIGGKKEFLKDHKREIDILITKRNKPTLLGEVKWGRVKKADAESFLETTKDFRCRHILFTKNKPSWAISDLEMIGPEDLDKFK